MKVFGEVAHIFRSRCQVINELINGAAVFDEQALHSDESVFFLKAKGTNRDGCIRACDEVEVRMRTKKDDADEVYLFTGCKEPVHMVKSEVKDGFDYYTACFTMSQNLIKYFFLIKRGEEAVYYGKTGVESAKDEVLPFLAICDYDIPKWLEGAVMYQIFVDRFKNADAGNDVRDGEYYYLGRVSESVKDWDRPPSGSVCEFYGGDLKGVMESLDYLEDMGIEVIYLNPIFVSPSNHKYDIQDYEHIDPHFGRIVSDSDELLQEYDTDNSHAGCYRKRTTSLENLEASDALFAQLTGEIHRRGMKIIIDGVFNHCGSFNKWLDRERIYEGCKDYSPGAYVSDNSPYRSFFSFSDEGCWPYNDSYDGWWTHKTLPKLNYEGSKDLKEYIFNIARKWLLPPYSVDGWRLDVAADLGHSVEYNHSFWKEFRKVVKEASKEAAIIAEHYGDAGKWLLGDEWDTVMNYDAFMEPVSYFLTGMEKHSEKYVPELLGNATAFFDSMRANGAGFSFNSLNAAMNQLSNHDHSRFLTRTNHMAGRAIELGCDAAKMDVQRHIMRLGVLIQFTWIGAPAVYYGDEAGVPGFTDPDNRRTYPWGWEDKELINYHRELAKIRRNSEALKGGSIKPLFAGEGVISYGRFTDKERALVIINTSSECKSPVISAWPLGVSPDVPHQMWRYMYTSRDNFFADPVKFDVAGSDICIKLPPESGMLFIEHAPDM